MFIDWMKLRRLNFWVRFGVSWFLLFFVLDFEEWGGCLFVEKGEEVEDVLDRGNSRIDLG